jgi:hypothetical protein
MAITSKSLWEERGKKQKKKERKEKDTGMDTHTHTHTHTHTGDTALNTNPKLIPPEYHMQ